MRKEKSSSLSLYRLQAVIEAERERPKLPVIASSEEESAALKGIAVIPLIYQANFSRARARANLKYSRQLSGYSRGAAAAAAATTGIIYCPRLPSESRVSLQQL